eukprot:1159614-Pelagomonas_calceolata.AAC.9
MGADLCASLSQNGRMWDGTRTEAGGLTVAHSHWNRACVALSTNPFAPGQHHADCGEQNFPPQGLGEDVQIPGVDIDYQLELNCAGPKHAFFMDTDGSLTGRPAKHSSGLGTSSISGALQSELAC